LKEIGCIGIGILQAALDLTSFLAALSMEFRAYSKNKRQLLSFFTIKFITSILYIKLVFTNHGAAVSIKAQNTFTMKFRPINTTRMCPDFKVLLVGNKLLPCHYTISYKTNNLN